ncbi:hypothetical protein, conserved [Eimeria maxima]|uniref:Transmembrane protein n=1 Tax=Eimeria maxima TaxID=5804 RepID=U6M019_EIMMA|nr:hypothetical protein, conserved [Eimeria maxima]CDJ57532.1 hypothetical protein, conserved [Eimeria maxima]
MCVLQAFPEHAEANAKVAAIRDLAQHIEQLRQEKARLAMFRHQTPKEIRSEYIQMMLTGLFTGLAAAIHPIFFVGTIGGLIRMRRTKRAEVDRDEGTKKMEELNRTVKERRAVLKEHVDALFELLSPPADRRCVRGCGGNNEKFAPERAGCETARANDEQQDTTTAISNTFEKQQYSLRRGNIDVASLLGIIAALTRELESKNVYIESNVRKMAALSDALERALCFETFSLLRPTEACMHGAEKASLNHTEVSPNTYLARRCMRTTWTFFVASALSAAEATTETQYHTGEIQ